MNIGQLPPLQRIAIASLTGTAVRHGSGRGEGDPIAELHEISTDPYLLGVAAGTYLTRYADEHHQAAARLLLQAGADQAVAAAHAEEVERRLAGALRPGPV